MQDIEKRIARSVELFKSGYNCSQSVVAAFASLYGFTEEQALRMAASFGGGIVRINHFIQSFHYLIFLNFQNYLNRSKA